MRYRIWINALLAASAVLTFAAKETSALEAHEPATLPPVLEGKVTGPWAKANTPLRRLVAESRVHQARGMPRPFEPSNKTLLFSRGRVVIDAVAADDPDVLHEDLRRLGLQKVARYGSVVSGSLPIGVIGQAVRLQSLRSVAASLKPINNVGWVTSEGVAAMYADLVHGDGLTGAGVTIGVLSDSYDQQGGAATDQSNGDLPPAGDITILDDSANCGAPCLDEGRAMMQLIYDVAPGSKFAFHTAYGGKADFANGIEELAAAGADIIVDDVIYFDETMFQDGIVARAVDNVVSQGVAYFSSAGNFARKSYEAAYEASGEILTVNGEFRGELHRFGPGPGTGDWDQQFTIPDLPDGSLVTLVLQWDEPFASLSEGGRGSKSDVDIYLLNSDSNVVFGSSIDDNILSGQPIEILQFRIPPCSIFDLLLGFACIQDPGDYNILISLWGGPVPGKLKYVLFQRDIELEYATNSSTLFGHANAAGAEAVGAAFYQATPAFCNNLDEFTYNDCDLASGSDTATLEYFSGAGGTATLFNNSGERLNTPEYREKPELVGPDGTNTTFFFADTIRDSDDDPNFFGTSASAPHVAGVGALMREANPGLSPGDMYAALEATALNMNPRAAGPPEDPDGFDFDTGYGFVQADDAVAAVATVTAPPPSADLGIAVTDTPDPVTAGNDVTYSATVTNSGSDGATGANLAATLPAGVTLVSATPSQGTCDAAVSCTLGAIASAGTATVEIVVTAESAGTVNYAMSASAIEADPNPANDSATAVTTVSAPNQPPVAAAGADQPGATTGVVVNLDGTGSSDPDGTIASHAWAFVSTPGTAPALTGASTATPSFTPTDVGSYTVELTVTDNDGAPATDTVVVTASAPSTAPDAVDDAVTTPKGTAVDINVLANDTPPGVIITAITQPAKGTAEITSQNWVRYTPHKRLKVGDIESFTYTIWDGKGGTDWAPVTVTIIESSGGGGGGKPCKGKKCV